MARGPPDVARGAAGDDPPVVDDRHRIAQGLCLLQLVGAEHERLPGVTELEEGGLQQRHVHRVEADERLVHQQHVGVLEHGRDVLHLLLVSLGQCLGSAVGEVRDPEALEPRHRLPPRLRARHPVEGGEVHQLVDDGHGQVEPALLRHVAPRAARPRACRLPVPGDAALVRLHEAQDDPHRGGLAGAVGAQEAEDLPRTDGKGDAVEGLHLAEALAEAVDHKGHRAWFLPIRPLPWRCLHSRLPVGRRTPAIESDRVGRLTSCDPCRVTPRGCEPQAPVRSSAPARRPETMTPEVGERG